MFFPDNFEIKSLSGRHFHLQTATLPRSTSTHKLANVTIMFASARILEGDDSKNEAGRNRSGSKIYDTRGNGECQGPVSHWSRARAKHGGCWFPCRSRESVSVIFQSAARCPHITRLQMKLTPNLYLTPWYKFRVAVAGDYRKGPASQ